MPGRMCCSIIRTHKGSSGHSNGSQWHGNPQSWLHTFSWYHSSSRRIFCVCAQQVGFRPFPPFRVDLSVWWPRVLAITAFFLFAETCLGPSLVPKWNMLSQLQAQEIVRRIKSSCSIENLCEKFPGEFGHLLAYSLHFNYASWLFQTRAYTSGSG